MFTLGSTMKKYQRKVSSRILMSPALTQWPIRQSEILILSRKIIRFWPLMPSSLSTSEFIKINIAGVGGNWCATAFIWHFQIEGEGRLLNSKHNSNNLNHPDIQLCFDPSSTFQILAEPLVLNKNKLTKALSAMILLTLHMYLEPMCVHTDVTQNWVVILAKHFEF